MTAARLVRFTGSLVVALVLALAGHAVGQPRPVTPNLAPTPAGSGASTAAPESTVARESRQEIGKALESAQKELAAIEASPGAALNAPPGAPGSEIAERLGLARQLAGLYQQQYDLLDRVDAARRERGDAERALADWQGFPTPPPYSVLTVDALRDDVDNAQARIAGATERRALFEKFAGEVAAKLKASQAAARLATEAADAAAGTPAAATLAWKRDLAVLRARLDEATRELLDMGIRNAREEAATASALHELGTRKLAAAGSEFTLTPDDIARVRAELAARRRTVDRDLERAVRESLAAVAARGAAEAQLAQARAAPAVPGEPAAERATGNVDAAREAASTAQLRVDLLKQYLLLLDGESAAWDARAAATSTRNPVEARALYEKLTASLATVRTWQEYLRQQMAAAKARVREQETRLRATTGDEAALAARLLETFRQRERDLQRAVEQGEPLERLLRHFRADIEGRRDVSLAERAKDRAAGVWLGIRRIWAFELFTVDDTFETADGRRLNVSRSITLGKTVGAVLIVVIGYLLVSFVARRIERVVVARGHVAPQSAAALRNWILFALTTILVVFALVSASIPLTAFAFLGGALAIAAGFGLQSLLKNLVAGIILLASRPMRLGDLVEVDGIRGRVTEIGLRASTIRTADGIESLIPNNTFLESKLINWTYTSPQTRHTIVIGLAYGTPLRKAADTLQGVLERHGLVLKTPAPQVYLDEYADSAINFALTYWVDMTPDSDARRIKSDLLHMIDRAFADAGLAMPFPQRDVHLDAAAPLRVEVVGAPPSAADAAG
jgi:small-conductance mechanosensitive channel